MNLAWDLESLYSSFQSEKYQKDYKHAAELADELGTRAKLHLHTQEKAAILTEDFLRQYNAFRSVYLCLFSYAELVFSIDNRNTEAANQMDVLEEMVAGSEEALASFSKWLASMSGEELDTIIGSGEYVGQHAFYLRQLQQQSRYLLSEEAEAVIARMQLTGAKAWERLFRC